MGRFLDLCVLLSLSTSLGLPTTKVTKDAKWDFLLLAQFWPPTSCYVYFGEKECSEIPQGVKGWTIHGLWPSIYHNQSAPFYCNESAKFDYNLIQSLGDELDTKWPNYDTEKGRTSLWDHEWSKHGTCAETNPVLKGELNYFSRTLQLHKNLNVLGALEKHGVSPSPSRQYKAEDFFNSLQAEYKVSPAIVCYTRDGKTYIEQIYLCFNKQFEPENCVDTVHVSAHTSKQVAGRNKEASLYSDCPDEGKTMVYFPQFKEQGNSKEDKKQNVIYFKSEIEETVVWKGN